MPNGEPVQRLRLVRGDLSAQVISYGAALQQLNLTGLDYSLVLGFDQFDDYWRYSQHYGANCGRVANRIANARLQLSANAYHLDNNFLGKHCLHGGRQGYSKRNWRLLDSSIDSVTFELLDPDACGGFPGALSARCQYQLLADNTLQISLSARAQQLTVCNLAHHSYFCLDASGDIRDHLFCINTDKYLPVDSELIPTGEIAPVAGSVYDFIQPRAPRSAIAAGTIYDHNYCLSPGRRDLTPIAQVVSPRSGLTMELASTEPGLQFYAGNNIDSRVAGVNGQVYRPYSGFCLEPQLWPAANSFEHFPSIELSPQSHYQQISHYKFKKATE